MRRTLVTLGCLLLGSLLGVTASGALGSRSSSGTYSLPSGNPVVSGTTISTSWANTTLGDIATELTSSLDRNGRGGMLAPLPVTSGTSTAPGLCFAAETNSGLYRAGAGDLRIQVQSVQAQKWTATGVTVPVGLTVTQSTTNGNAVTAVGNGTGYAINATGGSSNGTAYAGTGVGTGHGFFGTSGSTSSGGFGVFGQGATGSGNGGVKGLGDGAGPGVTGTGGASSGTGMTGTGGASSGTGVLGTGGAPNGTGVGGLGSGTGPGVFGTAGSSSAEGVVATGVSGGTGLRANSSVTNTVVAKLDGYVELLGGTAPAASTGFRDTLTRKNLIKAWALVNTDGSGGVTVVDGFNVSGCSISTAALTCTLATAMASTNYAVLVTPSTPTLGGTAMQPYELGASRTTTQVVIKGAPFGSSIATVVNWTTGAVGVSFEVLGAQ